MASENSITAAESARVDEAIFETGNIVLGSGSLLAS
jgi:hypothetical protein